MYNSNLRTPYSTVYFRMTLTDLANFQRHWASRAASLRLLRFLRIILITRTRDEARTRVVVKEDHENIRMFFTSVTTIYKAVRKRSEFSSIYGHMSKTAEFRAIRELGLLYKKDRDSW